MQMILTDENNPLYFAKDIEFARRYDVSRLTIYSIRDQIGAPSRYQRLLKKLKNLDLSLYTINDLVKMLGIKYQNLYKVVLENELKVKPDISRVPKAQKSQKTTPKVKEIKRRAKKKLRK